jgi:DnaJ family protein C protein 2
LNSVFTDLFVVPSFLNQRKLVATQKKKKSCREAAMVAIKVQLPIIDVSLSKFTSTSATMVGEGPVEAWGAAFERHVELMLRKADTALGSPTRQSGAKPGDSAGAAAAAAAAASSANQRSTASSSRRVVKLSEEDLSVNWYELLKLPNEDGSSAEEIRTAYRRRCLETHPDKQPDKSDELFKKVTRAFEILGDADARRAYDSSRPFDDSIPGEEVREEVFFTTFGPVFERNKKWSALPHMPSIGDPNTPLKQILKFYETWMQFRSWRDFSHEAELEEIDDGMCREEKRYYQRENERLLDRLRKAEQKRVRLLVERAQKNDPRLRKIREDELNARERDRREREEERQRLRDEEDRRRSELLEKDRLEQEARRQKIVDAKNAVKSFLIKTTTLIADKGLVDTVETNMLLPNLIRTPNIKWLFSNCTAEDAEQMYNNLVQASSLKGEGEFVSAFNMLVEQREQVVGVTRYGEPVKRAAPPSSASSSLPVGQQGRPGSSATKSTTATAVVSAQWSEEDLQLITKAIAKFPGGTVDRWRKISVMMKNKFTEEEVLAMTKKMEGQLQNKTPGTTAGAATGGGGSATTAATTTTTSSSSGVQGGGAAGGASSSSVSAVEEWTANQQKQLEAGLRQLKDYKEKDKFQKVAEGVDGKTARQCFDRYKFLCSLNKK